MLKKIVFAASAAALVLGVGTAALATAGSTGSPSASTPPSASGSSHAGPGALGTPSPSGTSGTGSRAVAPGTSAPGASARDAKARKPALRALGRALHAEWVTRDRDNENAFVTHHAIRGEVTSVSATSVTVKALDGVTQTYAITSDTKVHLRKNLQGQGQGRDKGRGQGRDKGRGNGGQGEGQGKAGAAGTISDVRVGDKVAVTGVGTSSLSATHVVDATN
jgi:hypothetical protein